MARNKIDVDERLEGEFNLSYLKRLAKYMKPFRKNVIVVIILMLISGVASISNPRLLQTAIDVCIPAGDYKGVILLGTAFLIILIITALISRYKIRMTGLIGNTMVRDLRKDVFEHLQKLPFSYFDSRPHGKILVRVINYVNSLSDILSNGFINLITDVFTLIVITFVMVFSNWKLALVAMSPLPVFICVVFFLKTSLRKAWQDYSSKNSNLTAYIHESIAGMRVTQAFSREEENENIFDERCRETHDKWMHAQKIAFLIWPMVDLASIIATCFLYVFGIYNMNNGITIGMLAAFSMYITMFWGPVINLSNFYNSITNAMAYMERVFELLDEPITVSDLPNAYTLPPVKGEVEFKNVSFAYEPKQMILKNVSFTVNPGESVALVGPTGAGKSTIVNLISRFYNVTEGNIYIDGHDISTVKLDSLRKQMGVMLQDTFIFAGTIADNIRYGKLDATDDEIKKAAQVVCADEFVSTLKDGYNTQVNERGSRLSVGQRQLISFARALLADPKILILDEATSSIDTETEMALQRGLDRLLEGRTSFIIAHRLSTIINSDKIMYIDKGRIIECGTHEELMQKQGAYYRLYSAQYKFMEQL